MPRRAATDGGLLLALALAGCATATLPDSIPADGPPETGDDDDSSPDPTPPPPPPDDPLGETLAAAFRIDISEVAVAYDFTPGAAAVPGTATLRFAMRPGQDVPVFHFSPYRRTWEAELDPITALRLDGEPLDPQDPADLRVRQFPGSPQRAIEPQRELDPGQEHVLELDFELWNWWDGVGAGWLFTDVDDISGRGNEVLFPTVNSPEELARHRIDVRVRSERPYRMIGSGLVEEAPPGDGGQRFTLDTEQPIASCTLMLVLMPQQDVLWEERELDGVPVRIASLAPAGQVEDAFDTLAWLLPAFADDLGPYPMPRGFSVLLVDDEEAGGMEYFGGTMSALWALPHELLHMWIGTSLVARTWRDSWWDEALNVWYLNPEWYTPVGWGFSSDILSSRGPIEPGFDTRAYDEGAAVFGLVAEAVGGRDVLVDLLAELHQERAWEPLTTYELVDFIDARTGLFLRDDFERWVGPD